MNWNAACDARNAHGFRGDRSSAAIWWRCANEDIGERPTFNVVAG
jgi:hypothetical protein